MMRFLTALLLCWPLTAAGQSDIRISLVKNAPQLSISGRDLAVADARTGKVVYRRMGQSELTVRWRDLGVWVEGQAVPAEKLVITASPADFVVQKKRLNGEIEVVRSESGGLALINRLDLERYLTGLINHEISSSWPMESLKAQAVVARTYALFRKEKIKYVDYDMESSTLDQVYSGTNREDKRSQEAVAATKGQVLTTEGELIATFYHGCCGGHTELPQHVWGGNYSGLSAVACDFCSAAPAYYWKYDISREKLQEQLTKSGFVLKTVKRLQVLQSTPFGRVLVVEASDGRSQVRLTGNQFRKVLGFQNLMSTYFKIESSDHSIRFIGGGNGHGVGMCQWGARGMAEEGYNYKQILQHYYPDAVISRADSLVVQR